MVQLELWWERKWGRSGGRKEALGSQEESEPVRQKETKVKVIIIVIIAK